MADKINYTKDQLIEQIEKLNIELEWYKEQFRLFQDQKFGSKSEKTDPEQMSLFNEAEQETDETIEDPTIEKITYERRKKKTREDNFKDLEVVRVEHHLNDQDCTCPKCKNTMHEMKTEIRKELVIIPATVKVVEHVRYIYACRNCEKNDINTPIVRTPMPSPAIPKSIASSSLIAFIMNHKYVNGMPLYRIEQEFKRYGLDLSRQNFANWMIKVAEWFEYLYDRMHSILLKEDIIMADETTVQVLNEAGRPAQSKSYMWMFRTGKYSSVPMVLYKYEQTRAGENAKRFLDGFFKGFLQVDGYAGYNKVDGVKRVGCMAHVRRKFDEALKAMPKNSKTGRTTAKKGFDYCQQLYKVEQKIKDISPEKRYEIRLEKSLPIMEEFSAWLTVQIEKVLPKSKLGEAIAYTLGQFEYLQNFLLDGRLEIDNNRSERSIKPFIIGRKNHLFSNTPKGAKSSAIIYSIVESAKENNLKPLNYLTYLLDQLPNIDVNDHNQLDALLPWSDQLPSDCKLNK